MSPTHHHNTAAGSAITPSALANFALTPTKNSPLYLMNANASPKPSPDRSNFSCLSKPTTSENYRDEQSICLNRVDLSQSFDSLNISSGTKNLITPPPAVRQKAELDASDIEDERYLGVGGFGRWGGERGVGGWVRKMGYAEKYMTGATDFGVMSTVYNLWFESKEMVALDTIEKTCHLVAKKLPHLRLCVGKRDNGLWWREMEELKLDIEEIETEDLLNTFEVLLKKKYDLEKGPLWFVRFIKIDLEDTFMATKLNADSKCRFVCMFGFHHNFSDGTTNMKFCDVFLKTLNEILLDKQVDMAVEAKLVEPYHDRIADKFRITEFIKSSLCLLGCFCSRFYKGIISYGHLVRNYTEFYPQPDNKEASTRIIPSELDEATTTALLKRCRAEKATLNSAFTAAANVALYKMILEYNPTLDSTHFCGIHTINMRRYWEKEQAENSCGCHISTVDVQIPTQKGDVSNFWPYARKVQQIMDRELNVDKRCITLLPIAERLRIILYVNSFLQYVGMKSTNDNHFLVTNMGNLGKIFPGTGEVVEVTKVMRSIACHYMPNLCQHTLHTFRGRLFYSLDYYTQKMKREHAFLYAKMLTETLKEISREETY